jgi:hypothetical protein
VRIVSLRYVRTFVCAQHNIAAHNAVGTDRKHGWPGRDPGDNAFLSARAAMRDGTEFGDCNPSGAARPVRALLMESCAMYEGTLNIRATRQGIFILHRPRMKTSATGLRQAAAARARLGELTPFTRVAVVESIDSRTTDTSGRSAVLPSSVLAYHAVMARRKQSGSSFGDCQLSGHSQN